MATKIKGIYKSFKYITQIFVVKEREMEIGYPTDVKHVAHIGWDGPSGTGPSWMNEFKTAPDFSTSIGSLSERRDPNHMATTTSWSTQVLRTFCFGSHSWIDVWRQLSESSREELSCAGSYYAFLEGENFEEPTGRQPTPNMYQGIPSAGVAKKPKRKKIKSTSSPKSSSASSRQSRAAKSKATYGEREATPIAQV